MNDDDVGDDGQPPVRIRRAGLPDVAVLAPLFDAYRRFYEQPADLERAARFLTERLERHESLLLIAETGPAQAVQAIGLCQCYPTFCSVIAEPVLALYDLFVVPEARGLGAARALMRAAEHEARRQGKARLDLTTAKSNLPAQRLYESLGWQRDEVFLIYNRVLAPA